MKEEEVGFTPLVDIAYQGFGTSLDDDAAGLRLLAATVFPKWVFDWIACFNRIQHFLVVTL